MAIGVKVLPRPDRGVSYVRATLKGMALTFRHMLQPRVTMEYPEVRSDDSWRIATRWRGTHRMLTDELGRSLMIWTAMLAAALLVREDGHIRITLVSDAVGPRAGLALYLVTQAITIGFLVLVIVTTLQVMPSLAKQRTVTLGISIAWVYAALPVASALMIVFALDGIRRRLLGRDAETHHADATLG